MKINIRLKDICAEDVYTNVMCKKGNIHRMIKFVISIFLVMYLSGCSTLVTHVTYTIGEVIDDEEIVFSRVYCGTKFNWSFQDTGHQGGNIFGLFLLPDLILSAAADTVLLPLTWSHDAIRTPTSDGIMDY